MNLQIQLYPVLEAIVLHEEHKCTGGSCNTSLLGGAKVELEARRPDVLGSTLWVTSKRL